MKNWLVVVALGMVAVLVESSLLAWPFLLLFVWSFAEMDERWSMLLILGLGVVLDVLSVRLIGVSSLGLLVFWAGLRYLRTTFSGQQKVEVIWLMVASGVWNKLLGIGGGGLSLVLVEGFVLVFVLLSRQLMASREIKLR